MKMRIGAHPAAEAEAWLKLHAEHRVRDGIAWSTRAVNDRTTALEISAECEESLTAVVDRCMQ